jgi:hypothetical protein
LNIELEILKCNVKNYYLNFQSVIINPVDQKITMRLGDKGANMYRLKSERISSLKKVVRKAIFSTGVIVLIVLALAATLFWKELRTLASLKTIDDHPLYAMTYQGDYGFDEFLKVGAQSDRDIEQFVIKRLLKGINIDLNITSAACTAFAAQNNNGERIYGR